MEQNKNNIVTPDELVLMIQKGFNETAEKVDVDQHFDKIEQRLDKIEALLLGNYKRRIEKLEEDFKEFKEALAIK